MPVYTESFTAATGTLVSNLSGWAKASAATSPIVDLNQCTGGSAGPQVAYYNTPVNNAHFAKCTISDAAGLSAAGVSVRSQDNANSCFYAIYLGNDGKVYAGELIAGTATDWNAGATGWTGGDSLELSIDPSTPTTIYVKRNGVTQLTFTSKNALSGGFSGVFCYDTQASVNAVHIDDWEGGDVAAASSGQLLKLLQQ